jgi:hypothetical protein
MSIQAATKPDNRAFRMRIARPLLLNHIVSPYGIAIVSTLGFLIAWTFPPGLYSDLIGEPDLIFFDAETLLYFLLCVAGFWAGLLLIEFVLPSAPLLETSPRSSKIKGFPLMFPLMLATVMTGILVVQIYKNSPDLLVMLLSQQGSAVKLEQNQEASYGPLGWASVVLTSVLWWTYWMLINSRPDQPGQFRGRRFFPWFIFAVGFLVQIALCVVKVSRSELMPLFGGLAVLYLLDKIRRKKLTTVGLLRYSVVFSVTVVSLFSLFSLVRGVNDVSSNLSGLVGYTVASYNRMTALLRGSMHYPYGGSGIYLSNFMAYNRSFNEIIPLRKTMGWPESLELWNSDFQAPQLAGLDPFLIWSGSFGSLFVDFGWTTPLILTFYGVIYGVLWRSIKAGTTIGLTLYPWLAFSSLFWFGANSVFDHRFVFFFATGLLLMAYEKLLSIRI